MQHPDHRTILETAKTLIDVTARAWQIRLPSPQAIARRAPHGYVSQRMMQRLHAANDALSGNASLSAVHA